MGRRAGEPEPTAEHLTVGPPAQFAVGIEAVEKSMVPALATLGVTRTTKLSLAINQQDGFDCPSCAWANPDTSKRLEFCEQGFKNVVSDLDPRQITNDFWAEHSLTSLTDKSEYWLGQQGRLTSPVFKPADADHYAPITWEAALDLIADRLGTLESPGQAVFYTSGRIMNEPAFLIQLLARAYGTNNLPDCNNLCHQATGVALTKAIGIGKSTVDYDDFAAADLIIAMGHNPGSNHPRMLDAWQQAKRNGAQIVGVNTLREASLLRFKNPQEVSGELGRGTIISDQFLHIRGGGDQHLLQAVAKRVFQAEDAAPGTVLDHDFLATHTQGIEAFRAQVMALDEDEILRATGLTSPEIDSLAQRYLDADATIVTWALGITQQKRGVQIVNDIVNLLLLRGNIGRPGAGPSPIRGHSNVQGERTMGITESLAPDLRDALRRVYRFEPPDSPGLDAVAAMNALEDGAVKVLISFAGNLVGAMSDTERAERGIRRAELTVQVATKLNRSHVVTGAESVLLPVLTREERDVTGQGLQFVTCEDTVSRINSSRGRLNPADPRLRSDVWVITELGRRLVPDHGIPWTDYQDDYDTIREAIARVIPGFENINARIRSRGSFLLPDPPRDSRTFTTPSGKAEFVTTAPEQISVPAGRLLLQTLRAHDQHNTTLYGLDDRYRGIRHGRQVLLAHEDDIAGLGLSDGQSVDVFSEWPGEPDRVLRDYRLVAYPTARGCAAMYFPEANVLVPRASVDPDCNTPTSKQVIIRVEPSQRRLEPSGSDG